MFLFLKFIYSINTSKQSKHAKKYNFEGKKINFIF